MITEFEFGRYGRARLWDGECPAGEYGAGTSLTGELQPASVHAESRRIAVEVRWPKGPRVNYGLLGARFDSLPDRTSLQVSVRTSVGQFGDGAPFSEHIALAPEEPVLGLPLELAQAVLTGVRDGQMRNPLLGPGILNVDCAAYGAVGSSRSVFQPLAALIHGILGRGWSYASDLSRLAEEYLA